MLDIIIIFREEIIINEVWNIDWIGVVENNLMYVIFVICVGEKK